MVYDLTWSNEFELVWVLKHVTSKINHVMNNGTGTT